MATRSQKQTLAFKGNIRQAITRTINGLNQIAAYDNSLVPGSQLPRVFAQLSTINPEAINTLLMPCLTDLYPPARNPA
jgi:hypothetical protein